MEDEKEQLLREKQRLGLVGNLASPTSSPPKTAAAAAGVEEELEEKKEAEQSASTESAADNDDAGTAIAAAAEPLTLEAYENSGDVPVPEGGASYLVYESDSSGRLVQYYSMTPIADAIGRWTTIPKVSKKRISAFKFKSSGDVIIAGCSGGVQGRKNYFSGCCQFYRSACHMTAVIMTWDPKTKKGIAVDIWVYTKDTRPGKQSIKLKPGIGVSTEGILAIACLPKNTMFYDQAMTIDINKWLLEGSTLGGSIRI